MNYACILDKNSHIAGSGAIASVSIGDKVLTQSGHKHNVNNVYKYVLKKPFEYVTFKVPWRKKDEFGRMFHTLNVTPNHKIPVFDNGVVLWKFANDLVSGDFVFKHKKFAHNKGTGKTTSKTCLNCGKKYIGQGKKFCSVTCRNEHWYEKGHNPHLGMKRTEKSKKRMSEACYKKLERNPELHPNRMLARNKTTSPEGKIEEWLINSKLQYEAQKHINGKFVDFFIPSMKLIIEADGEYWHQDQETDVERDKEILCDIPEYTIFHLRFGNDSRYNIDLDWNPLPNSYYFGCNPSMKSFVDLRVFKPTKIESIEHKIFKPKTSKTIYDLELHETLRTDLFYVKRVPGGWIYYYDGNTKALIFVPYNDEFQYTKSSLPSSNSRKVCF